MAEPLKNVFNEAFVQALGTRLLDAYPSFDRKGLVEQASGPAWEQAELKQRIRILSSAMIKRLPSEFAALDPIIRAASVHFSGLPHLVFPDIVALTGLAEPEAALDTLAFLTQGSTSEFAIRPFLLQDPDYVLTRMREWTSDTNEHVRRLASEGCRPRLPWAPALPAFKRDPSPLLPILEALRSDPSAYVRKSVANNLNDIAKDHPDVVLELARRWREAGHPHTDWILKHGCRTLLKQGVPKALQVFGLTEGPPASIEVIHYSVAPEMVREGETIVVRFTLRNTGRQECRLRPAVAIDFIKSGGNTGHKRFTIPEKLLLPGEQTFSFRYTFKTMTTRKHYPGPHRISLLLNGKEMATNTVHYIQ